MSEIIEKLEKIRKTQDNIISLVIDLINILDDISKGKNNWIDRLPSIKDKIKEVKK